MHKRSKPRYSQTFFKYATAYFLVIVFISVALVSAVVVYAQRRLAKVRTDNARVTLQQAADELGNQLNVFPELARMIGTDAKYLPAMVRRGNYYDIQLLDVFKSYRNYSPIAERYFLAYDFTDKIYTSEGYNSYFRYYAAAQFGMDEADAAEWMERITSAKQECVLDRGGFLFMVYPIRFYGNADGHAALCFVITRQGLEGYLEKASYHLPDEYNIYLDGLLAAGSYEEGSNGASELTVTAGKLVRITAPVRFDGWVGLFTQNRWVTIAGVAGLIILALAVAYLLASFSLKPVNRLIDKYTPRNEKIKNEFLHVDTILDEMRSMNISSKEEMQNQLLEMILRGYYKDQMLERWAMLGIRFDLENLCVYLIDTASQDAESRMRLKNLLGEVQRPYVRFYAVVVNEDRRLVVVANYADMFSFDDVVRLIEDTLSPNRYEVFAGRPCDSPKRLSMSYMEALTALSMKAPQTPQRGEKLKALAIRLPIAVKNGNDEEVDSLMAQAKTILCEKSDSMFLFKHDIYCFLSELAIAASQNDYTLDSARLNALVLLPDAETALNELKCLLIEELKSETERRTTKWRVPSWNM